MAYIAQINALGTPIIIIEILSLLLIIGSVVG
jgi:hypothetical protein